MPGQVKGKGKLFTVHCLLFTETKRPGFDSTGTVLPSFHDACLMNRFRDPYGAEIMIRIFLGYRDPYGVIVI